MTQHRDFVDSLHKTESADAIERMLGHHARGNIVITV